MRKPRSPLFPTHLVLVMIAALATARCGKPLPSQTHPSPEVSGPADPASISKFHTGPDGFRVFRKLLPSGKPDPSSFDEQATRNLLWDGLNLHFNSAVGVDDEGPVLSWPELADPAADAVRELAYAHETRALDGGVRGEGELRLASFDEGLRLWYVALPELLKDLQGDPNPSELQRVSLRFRMGGTRDPKGDLARTKVLQFHAFPTLRTEEPQWVDAGSPEVATLLGGLGLNEFLFRHETVVNPNAVSTLLLMNLERGEVGVRTLLRKVRWIARLNQGPALSDQNFHGIGTARITRLEVVRTNSGVVAENWPAEKLVGFWAQTTLAPNERVTLRWYAQAAPQSVCELGEPAQQEIRFHWNTYVNTCPGWRMSAPTHSENSCENSPIPHSSVQTNFTQVVGAATSGVLARNLRLALRHDTWQTPARARPVSRGHAGLDVQVGSGFERIASTSHCTGYK
jgi:hypothetical protein